MSDEPSHAILLVDPDPHTRQLLRLGIASVLGLYFNYIEAETVAQANDAIFDHLIHQGKLPTIVVSEVWVPCKHGELKIYPNELVASYPEIPMLLYTLLDQQSAFAKLKSRINLMGILHKPWDEATHPLHLARFIASAVS
jgi:hypothetical protein